MTVVVSLLFIALAFLFVGNEMVQNRAYTLKNYEAQQQELNRELAAECLQILEQQGQTTLVEQLVHSQINGSYRFCFLARENTLLQAKNDTYLDYLHRQGIQTLEDMLAWCEQQGNIVTTEYVTDSYGVSYTVGIAMDEDAILLNGKVTKHTAYVMMALAFVCMVFFSVLVCSVIQLGKREREIRKLNEGLTISQQHLENISEEMTLADEKAAEQMTVNLQEYDDELLYSLLKKTKEDAFFPVCIVYMKCDMGNRYVRKDQFGSWLSDIREYAGVSRILLEYAKGEFVFLCYRTSEEEAKQLRKRLLDRWSSYEAELHITMKIEILVAGSEDKDRLTAIFDSMKKRMRNIPEVTEKEAVK